MIPEGVSFGLLAELRVNGNADLAKKFQEGSSVESIKVSAGEQFIASSYEDFLILSILEYGPVEIRDPFSGNGNGICLGLDSERYVMLQKPRLYYVLRPKKDIVLRRMALKKWNLLTSVVTKF